MLPEFAVSIFFSVRTKVRPSGFSYEIPRIPLGEVPGVLLAIISRADAVPAVRY